MSIGIWQIVLILLIVVMIFGAGKLPQVMGDLAKSVKSFKAGMKDTDAPSAQKDIPIDPPPAAAPATKRDEQASS